MYGLLYFTFAAVVFAVVVAGAAAVVVVVVFSLAARLASFILVSNEISSAQRWRRG